MHTTNQSEYFAAYLPMGGQWPRSFGQDEFSPGAGKLRHEQLAQKMCRGCHRRRARFSYRGVVKWDRRHGLCPRCYRSLLDHTRAAAALDRKHPLPSAER
jgi:hypothetical protein